METSPCRRIGTGNPSPATISGNLALNSFTATAAVTRTFTVNDGAAGDDLVISAAISDGNGLFSSRASPKLGLGTMQFAGSAANTYTGTTTVNEGTLELNKTPGVNAMSGPLTIGDGSFGSGGQNSDVVRLLASNQLNGACQCHGQQHGPAGPERLFGHGRQPGRLASV